MILPLTSHIYAFQNKLHRIVISRKHAKCFPRNCDVQLSKYCPPNLGPFPPAVQCLQRVGLSCSLLMLVSPVSPVPRSQRSSLGSNSLHAWRTAGQAPRGSARGTGYLRLAAAPSADAVPQGELSPKSHSWIAQVVLPFFSSLWQSSEDCQGVVETPVKQQQSSWSYVRCIISWVMYVAKFQEGAHLVLRLG